MTLDFELTPSIDKPMNIFKVVRIMNRNDIYYLMRQVLLDSILIFGNYCFFYDILTKDIDTFNDIYGSFSFIKKKNDFEAHLYLNVDSQALSHIIEYLQTAELDAIDINIIDKKLLQKIVDLATIFGMSSLVSKIRTISVSNKSLPHKVPFKKNNKIDNLKNKKKKILNILSFHAIHFGIPKIISKCLKNPASKTIIKSCITSKYKDKKKSALDDLSKSYSYLNSYISKKKLFREIVDLATMVGILNMLINIKNKKISTPENYTSNIDSLHDDVSCFSDYFIDEEKSNINPTYMNNTDENDDEFIIRDTNVNMNSDEKNNIHNIPDKIMKDDHNCMKCKKENNNLNESIYDWLYILKKNAKYDELEQNAEYDGLEQNIEYNRLEQNTEYDGLGQNIEYDGLEQNLKYHGLGQNDEYDELEQNVEYNELEQNDEYDGLEQNVEYDGLEQNVEILLNKQNDISEIGESNNWSTYSSNMNDYLTDNNKEDLIEHNIKDLLLNSEYVQKILESTKNITKSAEYIDLHTLIN